MKRILKKIYYKFYQHLHFSNSKTRVIDSAKFLLDKKNNKKSILIWTTQKTASTFINKAVRSIAKNSGYKYFDYSSYIWYLGNKIRLKNPYQIESDCSFLYREYGEIYGPIRKPIDIKNQNQYKHIFFLRDPRDLLVSSFYSKSYSHEIPQNNFEKKEFLEERKSVLKKGIDNFCLEYADKWIIPYFEKYKEIKNNSDENHFLIYEKFIDNPSDFLAGVRKIISSDNGVFCFEVSYLKDVIENTFFDTIYHEHLDYHSLLSLRGFLKRNGFEIIDALKVATHGGSIRVISQKIGGKYKISESVNKLISEEYNAGLHELSTFIQFSNQIEKTRENLIKVLKDLKSQGKSIVGYGAPAKATTLMHHFDIGPEEIDYIVDDSKWKQNLYTPGKKIKILPVNNMYEDNPDYVLILAWNFAESIIRNNQEFKSMGGKFIIPLPTVEIV